MARARRIRASHARIRATAASLRANHARPKRLVRKAISNVKTHAAHALNHAAMHITSSTTSNPRAMPRQASLHPDNPPAAIAAASGAHVPAAAAVAVVAARTALVAGATGLVGRAVLNRLLAADFYATVHAVGRHPPALQHPKLVAHTAATFDSLALPE